MFVRYESFRQYVKFYPVTTVLIVLNVLVFLVLSFSGGSTDPETLVRFGAMLKVEPYDSELWRYVAAMFLHIGFEHLLFNCFALLIFAPPLELFLGRFRYVIFYLASGIIANVIVHLVGDENVVSAGASGAIYGIYAAYLYVGMFQKYLLDRGSSTVITTTIVIGFIYSVAVPQISLLGHLGGFVGGFILYHLLKRRHKPSGT